MMHIAFILFLFMYPLSYSQYIPHSYSAWFRNRDNFLLQHLRNFQIADKNYTISPFKAKYFQALHFCHFYGLDLISIDSKEENDKIHESLLGYGFFNNFFWTSGNKLADDKNWLWASSGKPVSFANWQYLEPNNKYGLEKCIELRQSSNSLVWNDCSCFDNDVFKYFICMGFTDLPSDCQSENTTEENKVPTIQFMSMVHQETTTEYVQERKEPETIYRPKDDCMQYTMLNDSDHQQIHININVN